MILLSDRQIQIIEALWTYQYLTASQLQRILGLKTVSYVNKLLKSFPDGRASLLSFRDFGFHPWFGRLPRVYYLRQWGVRLLRDELWYPKEDIKHPRGQNVLFQRDLFHRLAVVNFHIQFREWARTQSHEEVRFYSYFERGTRNLISTGFSTNNGALIPDGLWIFGTGASKRAFMFEQHNGSQSLRAMQQIQKHMLLLTEWWASEAINCPRAVGVFFVFEKEACMKNTLQRVYKLPQFEAFKWYFSFRCHGDSFLDGWKK